MKRLIFVFIVIMLMSSCSMFRKYIEVVTEVEVPVETVKIEYRDKLVKDSVYVHDSVYVYSTEEKTVEYRYRDRIKYIERADTLIIRDTIPTIITSEIKETVPVYTQHWWQKALSTLGILFLISSILFIANKFS